MANPLVEQLSGAVRRTPGPRRLLLLVAVVAIVAAVIGVALWAAEPAWVVLYSDVSLGESGRMTEALDQAGIRNKLGPDGTAVMV